MNENFEKVIPRKILLNPGPATTSTRVKSALVVSDICPREVEFGDLVKNIRKKTLSVVNAQEEYESILLGCSGTGAIESTIVSSVSSDGRLLIIENGAYGKRMKDICDAFSIPCDVIKFNFGEVIDIDRVNNFIKESQNKFTVMAFVHHETTTGILNPLGPLVKLAKEFNMSVIVDAMSSYAGIEIDLKSSKVDYLISSSNKCIQGMAGVGIVIVKKTELERIKSFKVPSFYFNLYKNFDSQENKGQFLFTPPVQVLYSLNEALDEFFEDGGITERAKRYASLYQQMFDGMCALGFSAMLDESINSKILTTFIEPSCENYSFSGMHDFLFERGITIYPGKLEQENTFRISNIGVLSSKDIEMFLVEMKNYIDIKNVKCG